MRDLRGLHILIVEDEWLLASELARFFADMGAVVLGPAATVMQAQRHVNAAEAAILDINLRGEGVFPVADTLTRRGVPFVFFSGDDEIAIPEHLRYASMLRKTSTGPDVAYALFPNDRSATATSPAPVVGEVVSLLPKLRLTARLFLGDVHAADLLVELTLEQAIAGMNDKPAHSATADWLNDIMRRIARSQGAALLH